MTNICGGKKQDIDIHTKKVYNINIRSFRVKIEEDIL